MKKLNYLFLIVIFNLFSLNTYSQTPEAFNYQAVIRDNAGELIINQSVSIRVSINDNTTDGALLYQETHSTTTSNKGLINLQIGTGSLDFGDFVSINWGMNKKYLQIEVDPGTGFVDMGTVQLLSVPYALYANNVANKDDADADPTNEIQDLNLTSNILTITDKTAATQIDLAPFQGTNTDEQTLNLTGTDLTITGGNTIDVSSLQDGVNDADADSTNEIQDLVLTGDTLEITNGSKLVLPYDSSNWVINGNTMYYNGGNVGIGSASPVSNLEVKANSAGSDALFQVINANNDTVFAVYPDGVKIFVDSEAKGKAGGFAISGRSPTKAGEIDILKVTLDSTRIYVSDTVNAKGKAGGFAISGRSPTKGITNEYLVVTGDSTRIYINDTSTVKGKAGGFAISGRSPTKGSVNDYLQVTKDSTRVYITESATKGKAGGFAISGRSPTKGIETDYFNVSGNSSAQTINPSESRIFWYPKKEAFLTGRVLVESADSIGTNSMATGYESKAIGDYSQAMGYKAVARGDYSTAIGDSAIAKGLGSFSLGEDAKALNNESYAIGRGAIASGYRSFAFGSAGIDTLGIETDNTRAYGDYSIALGQGSLADAHGAVALGTGVQSTQPYAFATGYYTNALGYYSTAFGSGANATGTNATAFGRNTEATGFCAVSFGYLSKATNSYSYAFGERSEATQKFALASGYISNATADYATAIGQYLTANKINEFVIGRYNSYTSARNSWLGTDPLFTIGNGDSGLSPSNAMVVYKNGNTVIDGQLNVNNIVAPSIETSYVNINGELIVGDYLLAYGGLHVGSETPLDPGTNNLIVDGTSQFKGITYFNATSNFNYPANFINTATFHDNVNVHSMEVDYNCNVGDFVSALGGVHVGGTSDPGTDNLIVDGSVGIGTAAPTYKLHVVGNSYNHYAAFIHNDGNNFLRHGLRIAAGADVSSTGETYMISFCDGDVTPVSSISMKSHSIYYNTGSDKRLKTNIIDTQLMGIEAIKQMPVVDFVYKESPNDMHTGFIAQDILKVFPEAVSIGETGYYQLAFPNLVPVLTKAIQEQQEIIENQKSKISSLEERLTQIEKLLLNKIVGVIPASI